MHALEVTCICRTDGGSPRPSHPNLAITAPVGGLKWAVVGIFKPERSAHAPKPCASPENWLLHIQQHSVGPKLISESPAINTPIELSESLL